MTILKQLALAGSASSRLPRLFEQERDFATVLLHHHVLSGDEPRFQSIEALRRRLDWLRRTYKPISVPALVEGLRNKSLCRNSVVITTDDARIDVYEAAEEFRSFEIPLAMFVCVGWVTSQDSSETNDLVRVVDAIEWYQGPDVRIKFGRGNVCDLSRGTRSATIDWILSNREILKNDFEELWTRVVALMPPRPRRTFCLWSELKDLASTGVHIGSHSVTHAPPLAHASAMRRCFEICESKRVLETKLGQCTTFAYPFGTSDTHNKSTFAGLNAAGFEAAFLSNSDFVSQSSSIFELPRITIPDGPMPLFEFKARVRGGGIPASKLKRWARSIHG